MTGFLVGFIGAGLAVLFHRRDIWPNSGQAFADRCENAAILLFRDRQRA